MPQILEQYGLTLGQPLLITYYLLLITYEQINKLVRLGARREASPLGRSLDE